MKLLVTTQAVDKNDPILGFFHGWLTEFAKHFETIDVICLKEGAHQLPENVRIHSLGKESRKSRIQYVWRFYKYFWKLYMRQDVEYVFFHMGAIYNVLAAPFFLVRKFKKTKFLWWKAHGHINMFGRLAALFCDEVVTSTASGFPINLKKRRIVGQAVDPARFPFFGEQGRDEKQVIFVGRITPLKHPEIFIAVAKLLSKEGYTFSMIGPVSDEAYHKKLVALSSGIPITFLGTKTQEELPALYQEAGIFLNTSRTDSMDKTVLEAMLAGCIPITANRAFKALLEDVGLYIQNESAEIFADKIRSLSQRDTAQLRSDLRTRIVENHSIDSFTERVFNFRKHD